MRLKLLQFVFPVITLVFVACGQKGEKSAADSRTISTEVLKDKIAGGWAGKMIGVTYGASTEFAYRKKLQLQLQADQHRHDEAAFQPTADGTVSSRLDF